MAAAAPAPVAVVGSHFCAPQVFPLTLTAKITGSCSVADASGTVQLRINVPLFRSCPRRVLLNAAGRPLLSVQRKVPGVWQVFRGDSGSGGDLLFTAKALPMAGLKSLGLDVFLAGNSVWNVADFKIRGDFCRSCYFYLGNSDTMIATMNRMNNSLGRRIFGVNVFPHVDYAFISVLVVILDGVNI
ncbi:unnamed protein product [Urochloa decumbens]|uniref:Uncharacterized protein n=1 Tax=Urochloa decumbens TaxID=240449 RepID=A0ABC9FNX7_9POAL